MSGLRRGGVLTARMAVSWDASSSRKMRGRRWLEVVVYIATVLIRGLKEKMDGMMMGSGRGEAS